MDQSIEIGSLIKIVNESFFLFVEKNNESWGVNSSINMLEDSSDCIIGTVIDLEPVLDGELQLANVVILTADGYIMIDRNAMVKQ